MVKSSFTEVIFHEGMISNITGLPGTGKTNVATFLMERAINHGFHIYTNVHFFDYEQIPEAIRKGKLPPLKGRLYDKKPDQIQTVTKISDLLLGLLTTGKNVTIIDEAGFFATSTAGTSKKVRQLKELAYIIRHLNSSLVLLEQSKGSVVPDLRKVLVTYQLEMVRVSRSFRTLIVSEATPFTNDLGQRDTMFVEIDRIKGIPMATIPWDGYFLPKFKFDIDLTDAFDQLGEYNSLDVMKKGREIIEKLKETGEKKKEEKEEKKKSSSELKREVHDEVRELFATLEDSGVFKSKGSLISHLAETYKKTYHWAYYLCRDLPFDETKYNPKVKEESIESG